MNPNSASGGPAAVSTSDHFSTEAAESILRKGGSAVDALIAAAAVQCVVSNGSTTVAGMWISIGHDAGTGKTNTVHSVVGPAAAETYDYDMDGPEAWGGRSMPIPAWVAGAYRAWQNGGRLRWSELFENAIALADAHPCSPATYLRVRHGGSPPLAARTDQGREIWMSGGRYIQIGDIIRQPALARTFRSLAEGGPDAFYKGEFAEEYVATSRAMGGRLTMADLAAWEDIAVVKPTAMIGDYCGHQIATEGDLMVYALHLAQAANIDWLDEAEAVYAQIRIMEEVFISTRSYSAETRSQFTDRAYAESRIEDVLSQKLRPLSFDLFWANTEVLAVRDAQGGAAWTVHSVNCPSMFGCGILAGGAYAVRVYGKEHGLTGELLAPGLFSHLGLFRNGKPHLIAGSPGFGVMHAPLQFTMNVTQRKLDPGAAMAAARFGLPSPATAGIIPVESHYSPAVFEMLRNRGVPYFDCGPSMITGRLSGIVAEDEYAHSVQDSRGDGGLATAFALT